MVSRKVREELKPVTIGLLLGLLSVFFGILWAVYLTVNHEDIHRGLEADASASLEDKFVINSAPNGHDRSSHGAGITAAEPHSNHSAGQAESNAHDHSAHGTHDQGSPAPAAESGDDVGVRIEEIKAGLGRELKDESTRLHGAHESPSMEAAHERLTMGHLHAMGLGVMTIAVSALLAFIPAPLRLKTLASACMGTGGIFYPLAWIVMGFRTAASGMEAAQQSVLPMVALSVFLVLAGILLTLIFLFKWMLKGE